MRRFRLGALGLIAAGVVHAGARQPALPVDCPPEQIRYSLLARELPASELLEAKGWRATRLSTGQAAALDLFGETEYSMAQYLAAEGLARPWLLTRCTQPERGRDIGAYVDRLHHVLSMARESRAVAIGDGESQQWWRRSEFAQRARQGQADDTGTRPLSDANPPGLDSLVYGFAEHGPLGLRTKGMRLVGLPDLVMGPELPGYDLGPFLHALADMALAGRLPLQPDVVFALPMDDPALKARVRPRSPNGEPLLLRWHAASDGSRPALRLELMAPAGLSSFEQQVVLAEVLWGSRYAKLGSSQARTLAQAIARDKGQLQLLLQRLALLQRQGGRLWLMSRLDISAESLALGRWEQHYSMWEEVLAIDERGDLRVRRWPYDPRNGAKQPLVGSVHPVGALRLKIEDESMSMGLADSWLMQDPKGGFSIGDAQALLENWAQSKPTSPSKPPLR